MREVWLQHFRSLYISLTNSQLKRVVITVSLSALGMSVAANYFFHVLSKKNKKKLLSKTRHIIQTVPELKNPNVRIKNLNQVELILSNLIHGGKQRLQVVSDFDRTISVSEKDGKQCLTSNAVLENSRFVSEDLRTHFLELRNFYMQIEHSGKLTREAKVPYMIEWWQKSFDLVVRSGVTRENIKEMINNSDSHIKSGCDWFFYTLERYDIPLLIFSAGLGDIIEEWISQQCGIFKNQKIIANFMTFDEESGKVNGWKNELIHVFNKNESSINDTEYEKFIENRHNLILIGDSIGDIDMASGYKNINTILKIGFLNGNVEEQLPKYMEIYDIVSINDPTFDIPNAILKSVI